MATPVQLSNPAMPRLSAPLVDAVTGEITPPWHRLLIGMWQRLGGGKFGQTDSVYFQLTEQGFVGVYRLADDSLIGLLIVSGTKGGPVDVQTLNTSPFLFGSTTSGVLTISSGKVELSRAEGTFYLFGLLGGTVTLLNGDFVRVSWEDQAPTVAFFEEVEQ